MSDVHDRPSSIDHSHVLLDPIIKEGSASVEGCDGGDTISISTGRGSHKNSLASTVDARHRAARVTLNILKLFQCCLTGGMKENLCKVICCCSYFPVWCILRTNVQSTLRTLRYRRGCRYAAPMPRTSRPDKLQH